MSAIRTHVYSVLKLGMCYNSTFAFVFGEVSQHKDLGIIFTTNLTWQIKPLQLRTTNQLE